MEVAPVSDLPLQKMPMPLMVKLRWRAHGHERVRAHEWRVVPTEPSRTLHFKNMFVSPLGYIVDTQSCMGMRNGGCYTNWNDGWKANRSAVPALDNVLTIASGWAGVWHFPMEAMTALSHVSSHILNNTVIHVQKKDQYVCSWLSYLGIGDCASEKVIDGDIFAKNLIVPRMGPCYAPYLGQLHWLRKRILMTLPPMIHSRKDAQKAILVMKRTKTRSLKNHGDLLGSVRGFAQDHPMMDITILEHSDEHSFPSLRDQAILFAKADIIIGPHGGGGVFGVVAKAGSCWIELMDVKYTEACYARMANLLHIHYLGLVTNNFEVDINDVKKALTVCGRRWTTPSSIEG